MEYTLQRKSSRSIVREDRPTSLAVGNTSLGEVKSVLEAVHQTPLKSGVAWLKNTTKSTEQRNTQGTHSIAPFLCVQICSPLPRADPSRDSLSSQIRSELSSEKPTNTRLVFSHTHVLYTSRVMCTFGGLGEVASPLSSESPLECTGEVHPQQLRACSITSVVVRPHQIGLESAMRRTLTALANRFSVFFFLEERVQDFESWENSRAEKFRHLISSKLGALVQSIPIAQRALFRVVYRPAFVDEMGISPPLPWIDKAMGMIRKFIALSWGSQSGCEIPIILDCPWVLQGPSSSVSNSALPPAETMVVLKAHQTELHQSINRVMEVSALRNCNGVWICTDMAHVSVDWITAFAQVLDKMNEFRRYQYSGQSCIEDGEYLRSHGIVELLHTCLSQLVLDQPSNVLPYLSNTLSQSAEQTLRFVIDSYRVEHITLDGFVREILRGKGERFKLVGCNAPDIHQEHVQQHPRPGAAANGLFCGHAVPLFACEDKGSLPWGEYSVDVVFLVGLAIPRVCLDARHHIWAKAKRAVVVGHAEDGKIIIPWLHGETYHANPVPVFCTGTVPCIALVYFARLLYHMGFDIEFLSATFAIPTREMHIVSCVYEVEKFLSDISNATLDLEDYAVRHMDIDVMSPKTPTSRLLQRQPTTSCSLNRTGRNLLRGMSRRCITPLPMAECNEEVSRVLPELTNRVFSTAFTFPSASSQGSVSVTVALKQPLTETRWRKRLLEVQISDFLPHSFAFNWKDDILPIDICNSHPWIVLDVKSFVTTGTLVQATLHFDAQKAMGCIMRDTLKMLDRSRL